jgi:hypothetical protein
MSVLTSIKRGTALALLCMGGTAAAASAASLTVSVPSQPVKNKHHYVVTLSGHYKASELKGQAYLVAAFQYDHKPCKSTAAAEFKLKNTYFFFHKAVSPSPFVRNEGFKALATGPRRVCAYLYPQSVGPNDTVTPIARASGFLRVVK